MAMATRDQVKEYLGRTGADDTADDDVLDAMITRAQARIETYCRTRFEADSDTTRKFDRIHYGGTVFTDYSAAYGLGGYHGGRIWFDENLAEITSVTIGGDTIADTRYHLLPRNDKPAYALEFNTFDSYFSSTLDLEIEITGRWAYSVTPPADIVHAAIRLAAYYFEMRKAPVFDIVGSDDFGGERSVPRSEPMDVMHLLMPYRFTPLIDGAS